MELIRPASLLRSAPVLAAKHRFCSNSGSSQIIVLEGHTVA